MQPSETMVMFALAIVTILSAEDVLAPVVEGEALEHLQRQCAGSK